MCALHIPAALLVNIVELSRETSEADSVGKNIDHGMAGEEVVRNRH